MPRLTADCANCFALCCVALPFATSHDFAITKSAGTPCVNLLADFRCGIHTTLRDKGFRGCTVFDCHGAGQHVSQRTFGGQDWRRHPDIRGQMFAVFPVVRQLHELLWYLTEALALPPAAPVHDEARSLLAETEALTEGDPESLLRLDVGAHRARVNDVLVRTSELVRATVHGRKADRRGADLIGAKLRGSNLSGANLRGAYLIATDLREANLTVADLIGADLRDADLRGADLTGAFFLTQAQVNAARGDRSTTIPGGLTRPAHWTS